ncbi:kelch-like protein 20 isoform X2 [Paramacrobiotus metropolitanus]|uniref:kelch-like protein 20 isoform X2 n=1 Tax=Paramacrobiotus metropolitanus TaxID=2943436 RepID=UPI002445A1AC|nr:kelch-like protein 20 isoform X2 [Paramacrobiotus metropolitanus]
MDRFLFSQPSSILDGLSDLRAERFLCDIVLRGGDGEPVDLPCHRAILSASSSYFRAMFRSRMVESITQAIIPLVEVPNAVLSQIVDFVYSGKIAIEWETVYELLDGALYLGVEIVFIRTRNCPSLEKRIKRFILAHLSEISGSPEFVSMEKQEVVDLFSYAATCGMHIPESVLVDGVSRWGREEPVSRTPYLREVLDGLGLPCCTGSADSGEQVGPSLAEPGFTVPQLSDWTRTILFVGGTDADENWYGVDCFDPVVSLRVPKRKLAWMPTVVRDARPVVMDCGLFMCGGMVPEDDMDTVTCAVQRYDPISDKWHLMQEMQAARVHFGAVALNGYIYAVGGFGLGQPTEAHGKPGRCELDSVERYDPCGNRWEFVAPLPIPLASFAAVAWGKYLYTFGGMSQNYSVCCIVWRYNSLTNEWTRMAPMPKPRYGCTACVAPSGLIYVIGGFNGHPRDSSAVRDVDAYNPITDKWQRNGPLTHCRGLAGVLLLDNKIYVMGGMSAFLDDIMQETVEVLDETELPSRWTEQGQTIIEERIGFCPVVMNIPERVIGLNPDNRTASAASSEDSVPKRLREDEYDPEERPHKCVRL